MFEGVRRRSLPPSVSSVLWTMLIALGVVLMHTLVPVPTAAAHEAMTAPESSIAADSHQVAVAHTTDVGAALQQVPCPSGHELMHPCIGTVTSFPAMSVTTGVATSLPVLDDASARVVTVVARAGRAPPWAVSSLDESVLLRV
ncbi:hypothetical protein HQ602_19000 [Rhodococcus kroppenstedtii]|uniref:DUF6153 family protein n=1 Tax=Rhodococcoides kroppenstedtii TaxID=293050 RepID=UPI001C9AD9CE|nr:DUF6153 family protein [Rhodococcus kroppenstedtii]MBY6438464.1 hypothetical protein [Rhodococcus kroppenstedtii]